MISCNSYDEIVTSRQSLDRIRSTFSADIETELKYNNIKLTKYLFSQAKSHDKGSLKALLRKIGIIESLGREVRSAKAIALTNACSWIETTNDFDGSETFLGNPVNADEEGARELIWLMSELQINDEDMKARIQMLRDRYGSQPLVPPSRPQPLPSRSQPSGPESPEIVTSSSELRLVERIDQQFDQLSKISVEVYRAIIKRSSKEVAVKIYTHTDQNRVKEYKKEADIIQQFSRQHDAFLDFHGSFLERKAQGEINENQFYIVMEYCPNTLIRDITLRSNQNNLYTPSQYRSMIISLLDGFRFMETKGVYHKDIKPHNIFIDSRGKLKIADFGISTTFERQEFAPTIRSNQVLIQGTDGWMSPELQEAYDSRMNISPPAREVRMREGISDVFSLGLVFVMMYTLQSVKLLNLRQNEQMLIKTISGFEPRWVFEMLKIMLDFDYRRRGTFSAAISAIEDGRTAPVETYER